MARQTNQLAIRQQDAEMGCILFLKDQAGSLEKRLELSYEEGT